MQESRYVPLAAASPNAYSQTGTDSYWNLSFIDRNGVEQNIIIRYSNLVNNTNFLDRIQEAVNVYGVDVETAILMVPGPRSTYTPSQITITSQRDFTRALSLLPRNADMYNPNRGFPVRVNRNM